MILDEKIIIDVKSSIIISKLKKIGKFSKIGDRIEIKISELWIGSNLKILVKCDICEKIKKLSYNLYNKNISNHKIYGCSNKCSSIKNKLTKLEKYGDENYTNIELIKKTKLEKYGDENYNNISLVKKTKLEKYGDENYNNLKKTKETNIKRYGVSSTLLSAEVIEKTKETNIRKYGIEDSRSSNEVLEKKKNTNLKKYGSELYMQSIDFKNKSIISSIKKYGFDSPNKSPIVKKRKIQSMIEKYGFTSNSMNEECKEKLKKTNLERYGVEYPMQLEEFFNKQQKNSKKIGYYQNIQYQGSYEKDFLIFLEEKNILSQIERGKFINYEFNGKKKIYFPDFYFPKLNMIIEIKSTYTYKKSLEINLLKMEKCIDIGYNFLFIIDKNYTPFQEILTNYFFSSILEI